MSPVGVLALQGAFAKHIAAFRDIGAIAIEVRTIAELNTCSALVIPGGESTTMTRLMRESGLDQAISHFAHKHPIWGTCAGLILMAKEVPRSTVLSLGILDISVERNAYGRQAESFATHLNLLLEPAQEIEAFFIRAPKILSYNEATVQVLARLEGEAVLVQQGHHLGSSFHPELTHDRALHRYFLHLCSSAHH